VSPQGCKLHNIPQSCLKQCFLIWESVKSGPVKPKCCFAWFSFVWNRLWKLVEKLSQKDLLFPRRIYTAVLVFIQVRWSPVKQAQEAEVEAGKRSHQWACSQWCSSDCRYGSSLHLSSDISLMNIKSGSCKGLHKELWWQVLPYPKGGIENCHFLGRRDWTGAEESHFKLMGLFMMRNIFSVYHIKFIGIHILAGNFVDSNSPVTIIMQCCSAFNYIAVNASFAMLLKPST
jgi:hypothetical protein